MKLKPLLQFYGINLRNLKHIVVLWILHNHVFKCWIVTELITLFYIWFFKQNRFGIKLIDIFKNVILMLFLFHKCWKLQMFFEHNTASFTCKYLRFYLFIWVTLLKIYTNKSSKACLDLLWFLLHFSNIKDTFLQIKYIWRIWTIFSCKKLIPSINVEVSKHSLMFSGIFPWDSI